MGVAFSGMGRNVCPFAIIQEARGHCNVLQSHTEDEANLGTWVNTQRQLERKEKLDPDRRKLLDDLGFNWAIKSTLKDLSSSGEVGIQV